VPFALGVLIMALDDREYYREELRRKRGFPPKQQWLPTSEAIEVHRKRFPGKLIRPGDRILDGARLAPGMSEAEIEAVIARSSHRRCGVAIAACAGLAAVPWLWLLLIYVPALVSGLRLEVWGRLLR